VGDHVFLSYVRENSSQAERLAADLRAAGVDVWIDRSNLTPGERWRDGIRSAIRAGNLFVACFSREYAARERSHMNEELTLAIEELRLRPTHRAWFIPVLLDDSYVPDRRISTNESLRDLQWVNLADNWTAGVAQIASVAHRTRHDPPNIINSSTSAAAVRPPINAPSRQMAVLKLKNFVRGARSPQHSWAKTFATIDPECLNLTRDQVIERIFLSATDDDLPMYLETAERMYRFGPHEEALSREFAEVCAAFGVSRTP
jgi:hypothetical protein